MATQATPQAQTRESDLYPIRTVSTLTGVSAVTLRAWERRYGLIKPVRTEGGHRLYTRADIDLIHEILAHLDKGVAVSKVRTVLQAAESPEQRAEPEEPWTGYRKRMVAAIAQFDEDRLEDVYNECLALYPMDPVTRALLMPLLDELGSRWESGEGSVAEEHFFGVYLRNKLGARFHHRARSARGPRLLAACLPGEHHEVGLLLFALAAHEHGFRLVLLGADMPIGEIKTAAHRARADAIVLSGSIEPDPKLFASELPRLAADGVPVFVGGLTSVRHRDECTAAGAHAVGTDFRAGLRQIGRTLKFNPAAA
jgi:DNA-binding transcriptional MerR regulator/methylmalonyl-CoA mutase cobalamin-binding subunit